MSTIGSFLIDTNDVGQAEADMCANFGRINLGAVSDGSPTRTRVWRTGSGNLTLDEASFTYSMNFTMDPIDSILLCRLRAGTALERQPDGEMVATGPGQVLAYGAAEGVPFSGSICAATYDLIVIDRSLLSDVAGNPKQGSHPISSRPVSPAANRMMVDAFDYVRHGVVANAHASADTLLAGALTTYLATAVVSAFPVDLSDGEALGGPATSTEVLVRRAMAFIDDHAHTNITPAEIAAAAHLTPPVLEMMFVRHHGCSPMQYLRRVRLNHAHHELSAADPATSTVADIAKQWGFPSVKRFAISYRLAYGRSPNTTLHGESPRSSH